MCQKLFCILGLKVMKNIFLPVWSLYSSDTQMFVNWVNEKGWREGGDWIVVGALNNPDRAWGLRAGKPAPGVWTSLATLPFHSVLISPMRSLVSPFKYVGSPSCFHLHCPSSTPWSLVLAPVFLPLGWVPPLPGPFELMLLWPGRWFSSLPLSLDSLLGSLLTSTAHSCGPALVSRSEP